MSGYEGISGLIADAAKTALMTQSGPENEKDAVRVPEVFHCDPGV
jgi:hypothetical protein